MTTTEPCQHIWNAHRQCQWCHRMQKDIDYEEGMAGLRRLFETVAPQCNPMNTLSGLVSQIDNYIAGFIRGDKWTIEKWREEYKLLMDQNDDHVAELNRRGSALQRIALLGDTMSEVHYKAFDTGPGKPLVNGWRVAEAMREVANDVIGNDPICDSCGGEGQVQLTDEGGNRMWWACPACQPDRSEPNELPDMVSGTEAECPWCHLVHDIPSVVGIRVIDCECGHRFEVEKTIVFTSRPMEHRK